MSRTLEQLSPEELELITKELNEVLERHNAEMGVTSTINLMKVVESKDESDTSASTEGEETDTKTA